MIEFLMPSLGADMEDGILVEWRKKAGDSVLKGDIIAEVETQKGLIEIEVFDEGIIDKLLIEEGTKVPVGTPLALIKPTKETTGKKEIPVIKETAVREEQMALKAPTQAHKTPDHKIKISPLARRIAEENQIDISLVTGTGENGVITKEDIEQFISQKPSEAGKETNKAEAIRAAVAAAMSKSNREIPHYYLEKRMDMTKALAWMTEANTQRNVRDRLLPVALLIKATALALRDVPELNAVWNNGLQLKNEIHIGFVVSIRTGGIIVPAIHSADTKSVDEIMKTIQDIIPRARALTLRSSELSDSTITVSSMGDGGADVVYGIIYPPQVAIIGFGSITEQPYAENGSVTSRPMIYATLSGDHRATDGLTGSRFLVALNQYLQHPEQL